MGAGKFTGNYAILSLIASAQIERVLRHQAICDPLRGLKVLTEAATSNDQVQVALASAPLRGLKAAEIVSLADLSTLVALASAPLRGLKAYLKACMRCQQLVVALASAPLRGLKGRNRRGPRLH